MQKIKISFIFNLVIFFLVAFSTIVMITGFSFMGGNKIFAPSNYTAFKYFTVDSNVLSGIISLIFAIYEILFFTGKIEELPSFLYRFKLIGNVGVTLTMVTTVCFLAPTAETGFFSLFLDSNLFFHLIIPLLCIISFIFFETESSISFKYTFAGLIPMIIYGAVYIANILIHLENGKPSSAYDWYGFLRGGLNTIWFVVPVVLLFTYFFSFVMWFFNKKFS